MSNLITSPAASAFDLAQARSRNCKRRRMCRAGIVALVVLACDLCGMGGRAYGQSSSATWTANGSGNWTTTGNWTVPGGVYAEGTDNTATFGTVNFTVNPVVTLNTPLTIGNITFNDSTDGSFLEISHASNVLTLDTTAGEPTISNADVYAADAREIRFSVVLGGTDGLRKTGVGGVRFGSPTFSTNDTYTGVTYIDAGHIRTWKQKPLGGTADGTVVASGASLWLDGGAFGNNLTFDAEPITINGTGHGVANVNGALFGQANNTLTWTGPITLGSNATIARHNAAGSLTIDVTSGNAINNAGFVLTFGQNGGSIIVNDPIVGGGGLTQTAGTVILNADNTYGGTNTLTAGTLRMGVNPVGSVGAITSSAIGTGTLTFNGGGLSSDGVTARTVLNPVTFTGNATLGDATNSGLLTFADNANLGAAVRTVTVNSEAQFNGILSGVGGGLTKAGTATLTLSNNNTYTAATTVSAGRLVLSGNNVAATGGITVNSPGIVQFNSLASINGTTRNVTVNAGGTALFDAAFGAANIPTALSTRVVATSAGAIAADNYAATSFDFPTAGLTTASLGAVGNVTYTGTLALRPTYYLGGGGGTLTMPNTNALTGTSALSINGNVVLAAANNLSGATTVNSGNTLTLGTGLTGQNGSVASASIVNNGTLVFNNFDNQSYGGVISGTGAVTKNGAGQLTFTAPQTYSGTTTLNAGTLVLAGGNHTLNVNKPLAISGGSTLDLGSNDQYVGQLTSASSSDVLTGSGGTLTVRQGNASATFAGTFNDSLNMAIARPFNSSSTSQFNLNLTNASSNTGTLTLYGGDHPNAQPSGFDTGVFNGIALKDAGRLTAASAIALNNGTLYINNNASSTALNGGTPETSNQDLSDRVNNAAAITLNGGRIHFLGRASTNSTESLGAVTANTGMSTIHATPGGTGTNSAELTLASLTRAEGATLMLDSPILGTLGTAGSGNGRIFVTAALSGNLTAVNGVIPGVFRGTRGSANLIPVGYAASQGFVPVGNAGGPSQYTGALNAAAATDNVVAPSAHAVLAGGQTINSLVQSAAITFSAGTDRLTLTSGMLLQRPDPKDIGTTIIRGELTSGLSTGELFLIKSNGQGAGGTLGDNQIHSVITDNGGTRVRLVMANYNRPSLTNNNINLTAQNTYTGGTVYSGGATLYLTGASEVAGVAPIPAAFDPTKGLIIDNSDVSFQGGVAQQIAAANIVTLNGGSTLTMAGANNTLAGLVFNSNGGRALNPTVTGGTQLTLTGNISSTPTDPSVTPLISVALNLNGSAAHDITVDALPQGNLVNSLTPLNGLQISSVISNGGFTKKGGGVLNLTNAGSTYAGQLTIEEGVLNVAAVNNVSSNGVLGNSASTVIMGGSGGKTGTLEYTGATVSSTKPFTMATGGAGGFQVDAAATTLTLSGAIDGGGGLTKSGAGTLAFSTAKTYTGLTKVSAGTLSYGLSNAIAAGGVTVDGATAILNMQGFSDSVGTVTLDGGGTISGNTSVSGTTGTLTSTGSFELKNGRVTANLAGAVPLNKTTSGTVTISGASTYSGATNISAGTLKLDNLAHRWSFNDGTANDSVGTAHGALYNGAVISSGQLSLDGINDYVQTGTLNSTITSKTLTAWVSLANLTQRSGSALSIGNFSGADVFDGIVYGERTANQWMAGSDGFARTPVSNGGALETTTSEVMIAIVYNGDNSITLYRNGVLYGSTYTQGTLQTYAGGIGSALMGLRHEDLAGGTGTAAGNDAFLAGLVNEARIYRTALTASEIASVYSTGADAPFVAGPLPVSTPVDVTAAGAALDLNSTSQTIASLAGVAGGIVTNSATTGAALTISAPSGTTTFSGMIQDGTGTVTLTKDGASTQVLAGANTYTGTTTIAAGTLQIGGGGTTGSLNPASQITDNGTLAFNRMNTLTQGTDFDSAFGGTGGVRQDGSGITILTGANSYDGPTDINAGTLLVNGNNSAATGAVIVAAGGTLGGTGIVGGATTVQTGGMLSPGASIGLLTIDDSLSILGAVTPVNSQSMIFELGTNPTGDRVALTSSFALTIGSGVLEFDDFLFTGTPTAGTYTLFDTNVDVVGSLGTNLTGTISGYNATLSFANGANNKDDIVLTLTQQVEAVPEPGTFALAALALVGLGMYTWRRGRALGNPKGAIVRTVCLTRRRSWTLF